MHGVDYFFVNEEEFKRIIEERGFLEYAQVYGNYYGTPKMEVMDMMNDGIDVVLEIDIQGALQIKEAYPEAVFIFILPPSMAELRKRITGRGSRRRKSLWSRRLGETLKEISYIDKIRLLCYQRRTQGSGRPGGGDHHGRAFQSFGRCI